MARLDTRIVAFSSGVITSGSSSQEMVKFNLTGSAGSRTVTAFVTVDALGQNLDLFGNVFMHHSAYVVGVSGSVAKIQGSGTAPSTLQPGSFTAIQGVHVGTVGTDFVVYASASKDNPWVFRGNITAMLVETNVTGTH